MSFENNDIYSALELLKPDQARCIKELAGTEFNTLSDENFSRLIKDRMVNPQKGCPRCRSFNIVKNGRNRLGKQNYKCKNCGGNFCASTGSLLSYTKKPLNKWLEYMECMCENLSIREIASRLKINRNTSFHWRHKILHAVKCMLRENLSGIIEMDEIRITESFKGNHSRNYGPQMNRKPRKRGPRHHGKLSAQKVNILCCKDSLGGIFSEVTGRRRSTFSILHKLLGGRLPQGAVICTNNNAAYVSLSKRLNLKLHKQRYFVEAKETIYHNGNAKAFGHEFIKFLRRFKGVATKYVNLYISWLKWLHTANDFSLLHKAFGMLLLGALSTSRLRVCDFKQVHSLPAPV